MSVIRTAEGYQLLTLCLQETTGSRYIYFDLGSVKGLSGYNVYRDNVKLNEAPVAQRAYSEMLTTPGTYNYEVETVYVDGTTSAHSAPVAVTIDAATQGNAPTDVRATMASYGYDVNVTMIDPTTLTADTYESFEQGNNGTPFSRDGWTNKDDLFTLTNTDATQGSMALRCEAEAKAELVVPVTTDYAAPFAFSFMARNMAKAEGNGEMQVLTSADDNDVANFINRGRVTTAEAWQQYDFTLPAGTKYVMLRVVSGHSAQLVDAISINADKAGSVYGYDIYRNGQLITDAPVSGPCYTDHNLLPGTYKYEVVAHYNNSAVSPMSEPALVTVNYTNGYQQPGTLSVEQTDKGNVLTCATTRPDCKTADSITLVWNGRPRT